MAARHRRPRWSPVRDRRRWRRHGLATVTLMESTGMRLLSAAQLAPAPRLRRRPQLPLWCAPPLPVRRGPNTGHAVLHSGTVGAALTGVTLGCRALAVSMASAAPTHLHTASHVAELALGWLLAAEPADRFVLTINVPDVPVAQLRRIQSARLAAFGAVQASVAETGESFRQADDRRGPRRARAGNRCRAPPPGMGDRHRARPLPVKPPTWISAASRGRIGDSSDVELDPGHHSITAPLPDASDGVGAPTWTS